MGPYELQTWAITVNRRIRSLADAWHSYHR